MPMRIIELGEGCLLLVPDDARLVVQQHHDNVGVFGRLQQSIAEQRSEFDHFGDWLQIAIDCRNPAAQESSAILLASYRDYCVRSSVPSNLVMTLTAFGRALSKCGLDRRKGSRGRIFRVGCALRRGYGKRLGSAPPLAPADLFSHLTNCQGNCQVRCQGGGKSPTSKRRSGCK